jgi:protein-tyrosine phosphatase
MGFFSKLFGSKSTLPPLDFSLVKTDMHSHLIPGIDDGSKSLEDSIAMLRRFEELGYQKVVTTPHVMSDFYKNTPEIILGGLEKVREAIQKEGLKIEIEAAAEYYLDFHFDELILKKNLLTFGQNHVLFELSFNDEPPRVKETIFNLVTNGYKPILAHVERYPFYINQWDKIDDYRERGVLLQLNINSLSGHYGPQVKKMAEQLIDKGWIDVIGSDCHHLGHLQMMESLRTNAHLHKVVMQEKLLNKML